ncbi:uncharacterized protein LTR77_006725 [Saxophila tyrrhenica]|uniref:Uncharacterized protein n=1 Tax=Saxophila tyrrhenica TaxID=1690608 RepID=A0AAV9P5N1_9PEZI|nr:hypothetical protein LTR77_006725 [Saxophila tyrrhenica]
MPSKMSQQAFTTMPSNITLLHPLTDFVEHEQSNPRLNTWHQAFVSLQNHMADTTFQTTISATANLSALLLLIVLTLSLSYRSLSSLNLSAKYLCPLTTFHALATEAAQLLLALLGMAMTVIVSTSGLPFLRSDDGSVQAVWALHAAVCLGVVLVCCAVVDAVDIIEGWVVTGGWGHRYGGSWFVVTRCLVFGSGQGWKEAQRATVSGELSGRRDKAKGQPERMNKMMTEDRNQGYRGDDRLNRFERSAWSTLAMDGSRDLPSTERTSSRYATPATSVVATEIGELDMFATMDAHYAVIPGTRRRTESSVSVLRNHDTSRLAGKSVAAQLPVAHRRSRSVPLIIGSVQGGTLETMQPRDIGVYSKPSPSAIEEAAATIQDIKEDVNSALPSPPDSAKKVSTLQVQEMEEQERFGTQTEVQGITGQYHEEEAHTCDRERGPPNANQEVNEHSVPTPPSSGDAESSMQRAKSPRSSSTTTKQEPSWRTSTTTSSPHAPIVFNALKGKISPVTAQGVAMP